MGCFPFGLQEKLVLRFVGESHNLGFYTGAITWADTLDLSVEKGRIRQTFLQDAVCFFVGEAGPARELFQMAYMSVHERELVEVTFSVLDFHILIMHAASIYAYGGSRLHASKGDAMLCDGFG